MKNLLIALAFGSFLLISGCKKERPDVRWQIKKEYPAYGLTLGYYLPGEQLQQIVGNDFTPKLDENGNGYLMLFIASAQKYYLDSLGYDSFRIAHILVGVESSLNCPLTIGPRNQHLNAVFEKFNFQIDIGTVELSVKQKSDSVHINAKIDSGQGYIELSSLFINRPDDKEYLESTKVSGKASPNSYFIGDEAYIPIQIDSIEIKSEGNNWISALDLPSKPDDIWLNTDFTWDFTFNHE
ncbi:MAG: hypothetical protein JXQ96_21750 [Cyclobacteriaceae bacterium]